jgi:hypothetical protein
LLDPPASPRKSVPYGSKLIFRNTDLWVSRDAEIYADFKNITHCQKNVPIKSYSKIPSRGFLAGKLNRKYVNFQILFSKYDFLGM